MQNNYYETYREIKLIGKGNFGEAYLIESI
jgi:hypothetical protein